MRRQTVEMPEHDTEKGKRYYIRTFGCQMNLADSERLAGVLDAAGYQNTIDPNKADVIVYNTCSIREKAEEKVYSAMGTQANHIPTHSRTLHWIR